MNLKPVHVDPKIGIEYPNLPPEIPLDPKVDEYIDISRFLYEEKTPDKIASRVYVTYKGSPEDRVLYQRLPSEITGTECPKYVLVRNRSRNPDGTSTVIGQIMITTLGSDEPDFVTYNSCSAQEKEWVLKQFPEKKETWCTLF